MKLDPCFTLYTKINAQWNNLQGKIITDENLGRYLYDLKGRIYYTAKKRLDKFDCVKK